MRRGSGSYKKRTVALFKKEKGHLLDRERRHMSNKREHLSEGIRGTHKR